MTILIGMREVFLLIKKRSKVFHSILILVVLITTMGIGKIGVGYLNIRYDSQGVSKRAMFALPIQQISCYMVYHSDDVTKEEMQALQKVMKWSVKSYKKRYNPLSFDSVKTGFNNEATGKEIAGYLKVWFKLFWRHPGTYVNATMNQNYFLFSPFIDNCRYYRDVDTFSSGKEYDLSGLYSIKTGLKVWQQKLFEYYHKFVNIPVLGLLVNQGVYSILLVGVCLYALCERNWKLLFLSVPMVLTLLIALVAPAAYGNARYTYPIMYAMPMLFSIFVTGMGVKENLRSNENERLVD